MRRVGTLADRLRRLSPSTIDTVAATLLGAGVLIAGVTADHPSIVKVVAGLGATATVAFRRRRPALSVLLGDVLSGASGATLLPIAVVLNYYALGQRSAERGWRIVHVGLVAFPLVPITFDPSTPSTGNPLLVDVLSVWGFFFALPFVAGRILRSRSLTNAELQASARRLAEEQRARARRAAGEERTRIARELHDVVAHSVSVMVIQTGAARRIAAHDPERAAEALRAVEACGRDALVDLRRMVGVLHRGDLAVIGGAQPGLGQLEPLVERARASGLAVELRVEGTIRDLPPALDLVSFRVIQEALTNAIKHAAPARAHVRVRFSRDTLELDVTDTGRAGPEPPSSEPSGHGLVGMQERLTLYGGTLRTERIRSGGFEVRARIPLPDRAPA